MIKDYSARLLKMARKKEGLTQQDLADLLGTTKSWIGYCEIHGVGKLVTLARIANALGYELRLPAFIKKNERRRS